MRLLRFLLAPFFKQEFYLSQIFAITLLLVGWAIIASAKAQLYTSIVDHWMIHMGVGCFYIYVFLMVEIVWWSKKILIILQIILLTLLIALTSPIWIPLLLSYLVFYEFPRKLLDMLENYLKCNDSCSAVDPNPYSSPSSF